MMNFRRCIVCQLTIFLLLVPLAESLAGKHDYKGKHDYTAETLAGKYNYDTRNEHGGWLSLTTTLTSETGTQPGMAEGNETLTYSITLDNSSKKSKTISVTENVPLGTSYVGGDSFDDVCIAGDVAGTVCQLDKIKVPGKGGSITLTFIVKVDDPVTTLSIDNNVTSPQADCLKDDCTEFTPTTGIDGVTRLEVVDKADWTETSVIKVLHAFAYAGLTTDAQIATWASMPPEVAIQEMLTFTFTNELLSPSEDASSAHAVSLEAMENFWGGTDVTNPMRWDKRPAYSTLTTRGDGSKFFNGGNLQRTWIQAVNTRGINPFLHKIGFFLTNYQMAIKANLSGYGLFRSYYDQTINDLASGQTFTAVIAGAAKSAATARRYGHLNNTFNNSSLTFKGNDDFAREFFQLFFRYNGVKEDIDYHEGVNIENNAMLMTGMKIDYVPNGYGSDAFDYIAPINFTDHTDASDRVLNNLTLHHADCLEIFHQMICGTTASEKIDALAAVVSVDPEVQTSLPVFIIKSLADDQLTDEKIAKISATWVAANDDLLSFIREYAISRTFHSEDTVKFRSTFDRNVTLYNTVVLDNEESFIGRQVGDSPHGEMIAQGGEVFLPAHNVFGGQTGVEAANNANVFNNAYNVAGLQTSYGLARTVLSYSTDETQTTQVTWDKDWGEVIPTNSNGEYVVADVADWLWRRVVADGGKNFDVIARAQVIAILARNWDFGYAVTVLDPSISTDPEATYSSNDLTSDARLVAVMNGLAAETMDLASPDITTTRRGENNRVSFAANFISMLPYTFALEGK